MSTRAALESEFCHRYRCLCVYHSRLLTFSLLQDRHKNKNTTCTSADDVVGNQSLHNLGHYDTNSAHLLFEGSSSILKGVKEIKTISHKINQNT
ncbi:hypothetical protein Hanom_Chr17g01545471 [Helianthus anomalus]